jgi:hypothetical protein
MPQNCQLTRVWKEYKFYEFTELKLDLRTMQQQQVNNNIKAFFHKLG